MKIISRSERETRSIGERLARGLMAGDIICLHGTLGSGKTVLVKGIAAGLGIEPGEVCSPTFVLMHQYTGRLTLNHLDLYRLEETRQVLAVGYEDYLYGNAVAAVEWAERLGKLTPRECLEVGIGFCKDPSRRVVVLRAKGKRYADLLRRMRS